MGSALAHAITAKKHHTYGRISKATSRILFPFSTVETGDFSGDSASAADSAGTSPPAPLLAFEGEGLGGSAVDL